MLKFRCANAAMPRAPLYLCISAALFLTLILSCSHSMDKTGNLPREASAGRIEVEIKHSWNGDFPVDQLALLAEKADQKGAGYFGDAHTFKAVWSIFKPGGHEPDVDFNENLVIFVRNIQYYNRIMIGKVILKDGVASVMAMETLSARPIEEVVALSMVVISREGVDVIQLRDGVLQVPK